MLLFLISGIDLSKKSDSASSASVISAAANDKEGKATAVSKEDSGRKSAIPVGIAVARQRSGAASKQKGVYL